MVTFVQFIIVCAYIIAVVSALPMGIRKRQLNGIQTNCKAGYFALTFDDGPYMYTDTLLTKLDQQGIKATFFITGDNFWNINNNTKAQNVIKKMYSSGHQIASHTWSHANLNRIPRDRIVKEMIDVEDALMRIIGVKPVFMRPPFGNANKTVTALLNSMGYTVVNWSVDSKDYVAHDLDDEMENYHNDLRAGSSPKGAIALGHDVYKQTVEELATAAIKYARSRGYKFSTVADCFNASPYH